MQRLTSILASWMIPVLTVAFLTGCANTPVQSSPKLPPIYIVQNDLSCMATETKRQILSHNCKVDYDPKFCKTK